MRTEIPDYSDEEFEKSLERAIKLVHSHNGSGEQTFLSGIRVSFDLIYPNYISPELQRYHWIDIVNSSSKMHRLMRMDMDKCCNKYVFPATKEIIKEAVSDYNQWLEREPEDANAHGYWEEKRYELFMKVLSNCPQGIELFMRVSTNYLQLKTIFLQRQHHKLKEDWGAFCDFIKSLPYADELICTEK